VSGKKKTGAMYRSFVALFFFVCVAVGAQAQGPAQSAYVELLGPGLASINFDTRFTKKEDGIGGRVGVGYLNMYGDKITTVPIGITYLLGKDGKNYFEVGGGVTLISYKANEDFTREESRYSETFGHLNFGYRMQPRNGGFLFRAAFNPVFIPGNGFFPFYGGISFGYKF
jgi:hypothetical protein